MVLAFHANFQSVAKRRNCLALSKIGLPISIFGYQDLQNIVTPNGEKKLKLKLLVVYNLLKKIFFKNSKLHFLNLTAMQQSEQNIIYNAAECKPILGRTAKQSRIE